MTNNYDFATNIIVNKTHDTHDLNYDYIWYSWFELWFCCKYYYQQNTWYHDLNYATSTNDLWLSLLFVIIYENHFYL